MVGVGVQPVHLEHGRIGQPIAFCLHHASSILDEFYQLLHIVKIVVIPNHSLAVIDDTPPFVFRKAVQQPVDAIPFDE